MDAPAPVAMDRDNKVSCCCVAEGGQGCCCIAEGGEGCCCIGRGSRGWCCILPNCIGLCFCCAVPTPARKQEAAFALPMRQVNDQMLRKSVPAELVHIGVEAHHWERWLDVIDATLREHDFFYEKPCSECCFHCCPCGPLQVCYCLANPWVHRQQRRVATGLEAAAKQIDTELRALTGGGRFECPPASPYGVFYDASAAMKRPLAVVSLHLDAPSALPDLPPELTKLGVSTEQWNGWLERMDEARRAHICHACPALAVAYLCVPFGPVQCCVCSLLNPFHWWHSYRVHSARRAAAAAVNAELVPLGAHLSMGPVAGEFHRGVPKARKRKSRLGATVEIVTVATGGALASTAIGGLTARAMEEEEPPELGRVKV